MKYQAPPGGAVDAPYLDGNRSAGTKGSVMPAAAIEHHQRELVHLIEFSGQVPSALDLEQARKAIQLMIAAATGGGETSQYLLVDQARVRLPFFPEIVSADGRMNVTSPAAGTILVPPTVALQHRGVFPLNTSDYAELDRTFATAASKTYHLRWTPGAGFDLKDTANAGYNPDAVAEADARFDTTFDDMLIARVVTNSSNIATITNLSNKPQLATEFQLLGTNIQLSNQNGARFDFRGDFNWSRRPPSFSFTPARISTEGPNLIVDHDFSIALLGAMPEIAPVAFDVDRYRIAQTVMRDFAAGLIMHFSARA